MFNHQTHLHEIERISIQPLSSQPISIKICLYQLQLHALLSIFHRTLSQTNMFLRCGEKRQRALIKFSFISGAGRIDL